MKLNFMSTRFLRILVAAGYLLMCLLAGGIMYLWHYEWKEIEALETENQRINNFRQEIHHVYGEMTGLSLLGESVLEWKTRIWSITIFGVWQWTVCYAVSKRFIQQDK